MLRSQWIWDRFGDKADGVLCLWSGRWGGRWQPPPIQGGSGSTQRGTRAKSHSSFCSAPNAFQVLPWAGHEGHSRQPGCISLVFSRYLRLLLSLPFQFLLFPWVCSSEWLSSQLAPFLAHPRTRGSYPVFGYKCYLYADDSQIHSLPGPLSLMLDFAYLATCLTSQRGISLASQNECLHRITDVRAPCLTPKPCFCIFPISVNVTFILMVALARALELGWTILCVHTSQPST